ncbi:MAG: Fic family protein [Epsilonproteobacteria bacterium]|nr:Fic family protein [Campylobacterota bacterium]
MATWIWEHATYPAFPYRAEVMINEVDATAQSIGKLSLIIKMLDSAKEETIKIDTLIDEIVSSNAIEGEYLNRDSVRSSVRKRLDTSFDIGEDSSTHHTDALTALLLDSNLNHETLTLERLHQWHISLFAGGYSTLLGDINYGEFRDYDDMEVVSGSHGREKIHYRAIPHSRIEEDTAQLLEYINTSTEHPYIKSAKAHLWFVTIHPYDDGNGRIARVIADYILSKDMGLEYKYFSISSAIHLDKKGYYEALEQSQKLLYNPEYDFTKWIVWHTKTLKHSIERSLQKVDIVMQKARFWKQVDIDQLHPRQIKILNKLLEYGVDGFEGGLSTKKYMSMAKVSKPTAVRDIQNLVALGYLKQVKGTAGRSTKYALRFGD